MAKGIVVEITQEDISYGVRQHSAKCIIARSLKRAYPAAQKVSVDIQSIRFTNPKGPDGPERICWLTPPDAQRLIVYFDGGELSELEPFTFRLLRRYAFRIQRQVEQEGPRERKRGAPRAARRVDVPAGQGTGVVPHHRKPATGTTQRVYGMRTLHVNQARVRNGDLGEVEPIPEDY